MSIENQISVTDPRYDLYVKIVNRYNIEKTAINTHFMSEFLRLALFAFLSLFFTGLIAGFILLILDFLFSQSHDINIFGGAMGIVLLLVVSITLCIFIYIIYNFVTMLSTRKESLEKASQELIRQMKNLETLNRGNSVPGRASREEDYFD